MAELIFLNVGYGEAILLRQGEHTAIIDGGSGIPEEYTRTDSGRMELAEYLRHENIRRIDVCVLTHIHEDHIGGLQQALALVEVGMFVQTLPVNFYKGLAQLDVSKLQTEDAKLLVDAIHIYRHLCETYSQVLRQASCGENLTLVPGVSCRFLGPEPQQVKELLQDLRDIDTEQALLALNKKMNSYSLIVRLNCDGVRVLLPGDADAQVLSRYNSDELQADVFKVGHHGQRDGLTEMLLRRIAPRLVVCCASSDKKYNSADETVTDMVIRSGAQMLFSDSPKVKGMEIPKHTTLTIELGTAMAVHYGEELS